MRDRDSAARGAASAGSGEPNEITVLFDDRTLSFAMPAAATLEDLAGRLAAASGPRRRQMRSVTVRLAGPGGGAAPGGL